MYYIYELMKYRCDYFWIFFIVFKFFKRRNVFMLVGGFEDFVGGNFYDSIVSLILYIVSIM